MARYGARDDGREGTERSNVPADFPSFEAFRKALTPKRLELLHAIKTAKPRSLHELAEVTKRDIKNVSEDVKYLEQIGLIEKRGDRREVVPVIGYDRIALEIAI